MVSLKSTSRSTETSSACSIRNRLLSPTASQMRRRLWLIHRVLALGYMSLSGHLIESSHAMRTLNVVVVLARRWWRQVRQVAAFFFHFSGHFCVPNRGNEILVFLAPISGFRLLQTKINQHKKSHKMKYFFVVKKVLVHF